MIILKDTFRKKQLKTDETVLVLFLLLNNNNLSKCILFADWFKACQALETLGLIALLLAFIILFLYMFVESCRGRNALMAIMMCTFAGGKYSS